MTDGQTIGEEFYAAYAAGTLDPALVLLVETQAALREDVRRSLHFADAISSYFLKTEKTIAMSEAALPQTLALLQDNETNTDTSRKAARIAGNILEELILLPEPLRQRALQAAGQTGWKFGGHGLKVMPLRMDGDATVELLRIEPGSGAPRHTHDGQEYTLVVSGAFTDETGTYGPGDLSIAGPDCEHRPVADPGVTCFALAVRDGDLRFKGALGLLQRIFS